MCFTDDGVKKEFLVRYSPLNREELDSRGTSSEPSDYRHRVVELFNSNTVFTVAAMPDLHPDFSDDIECPLTVNSIDIVEVGKRLQNMKVSLNHMKIQWERSGSGSYMRLGEEDEDYRGEDETYKFLDGDDRKSFLKFAQNKVYILFWWETAHKHQLLSSALENLDSHIAGDGASIPSARSKGGTRMNVFEESHLSRMDNISKHLVAMVEIKTRDVDMIRMEKLMAKQEAKIKDVSGQMEKKQEKLGTISPQMWELKFKLHDEFQVEESSFFAISSADGFAIKMYKSRLRDFTQQQTGLDDDLLDLEEQKTKMVKELEEMELEYSEYKRKSKKRSPVTFTEEVVPTSVRKQRKRGEGGVSAAMSTTSAMSDNFSLEDSE
jgi:hypothetical protein